jgi:hypothetical protein
VCNYPVFGPEYLGVNYGNRAQNTAYASGGRGVH